MFWPDCRRVCAGLFLFALFVLAAGCGPDYKSRGTVKGKVTIGGKNLTTGSVVFYGKHGNMTGTGVIDVDGNYVVNDAPLGENKVTVTVPKMPATGLKHLKNAPKGPTMPGEENKNKNALPSVIVPIPEKYATIDTSPLTFTVERGEQTYNIDLKP